MTLLVLSPAYASHYGALAVLARRAASDGTDVVVATGPAMRARVQADGFVWRELVLGSGHNDGRGVVADDAIERFFDATRHGMMATLRHQAAQRRHDLLWEPDRVVADIGELVDEVDPAAVLVDQVSLTSTLAMLADGRPFVTLVPGHPSQLPVGGEMFGCPSVWPASFTPEPAEVADLLRICTEVTEQVTETFRRVLAPNDAPVDAFRAHGSQVLYPWPAVLHGPDRAALLPQHVDIGPLLRDEALGPADVDWLGRRSDRPLVVVALGTFLSARVDVLRRVAAILRELPVRVALAIGDNDPADLGDLPADWLVGRVIPQVALLAHADVAISHAGGGSAGEALAAGVPQLLLPFSTDQFATAADLERLHVAVAVDPNRAEPVRLRQVVEELLDGGLSARAAELAACCREQSARFDLGTLSVPDPEPGFSVAGSP